MPLPEGCVLIADCANPVTLDYIERVTQESGVRPSIWARELVTIPGIASGLTMTEVELLEEQKLEVFGVWNQGGASEETAKSAVSAAHAAGLMAGDFILADIEESMPVPTTADVRAWQRVLSGEGFRAGIYGAFGTAGTGWRALWRDYLNAVKGEIEANPIYWAAAEWQKTAAIPTAFDPPLPAPDAKRWCVWWQFANVHPGEPTISYDLGLTPLRSIAKLPVSVPKPTATDPKTLVRPIIETMLDSLRAKGLY